MFTKEELNVIAVFLERVNVTGKESNIASPYQPVSRLSVLNK